MFRNTVFIIVLLIVTVSGQTNKGWLDIPSGKTIGTILPPSGVTRIPYEAGSFASWLRDFPLKPEGSPVFYYNGRKKPNQSIHCRVLDIDVGSKDLQQCADAIMRLYSEFLFEKKLYAKIHFNFTSGDRAEYEKWREGWRPLIKGNSVTWRKTTAADTGYSAFRKYLNSVFMYAGTYSLQQELQRVSPESLKPGDLFLQGGFPGHAVLIVDMAENKANGQKYLLLAQSYMPAQDIHILKNLNDTSISPWYELEKFDKLFTPEWTFDWKDCYRFPD